MAVKHKPQLSKRFWQKKWILGVVALIAAAVALNLSSQSIAASIINARYGPAVDEVCGSLQGVGAKSLKGPEAVGMSRIYSGSDIDYFRNVIFPEFTFHMQGGRPGKQVSVDGTVAWLGIIKVTDKKELGSSPPFGGACPVCLAGKTLIDTPTGLKRVADLAIGAHVYTQDEAGQRVEAQIVRTRHRQVPNPHKMVHVRLTSGKELFAASVHPSATGRALGSYKKGEMLDGAIVTEILAVNYPDGDTYDILPAGSTGTYWANGILIGSTLHEKIAHKQ